MNSPDTLPDAAPAYMSGWTCTNLTGSVVRVLQRRAGRESPLVLPPAPAPARVRGRESTIVGVLQLPGDPEIEIPLCGMTEGDIVGLPPESPDGHHYFLVTADVALHPSCRGRTDLLVPGPLITAGSATHAGFRRYHEPASDMQQEG